MKRALLLDFDGVVVRNRMVHRVVADACTTCVARKAGVSLAEARRVNDALYPRLGHSSLVLTRHFGVPTTPSEFNATVYDELLDYDFIARCLRSRADQEHARALANMIDSRNTLVFSNAPWGWCERILSFLGIGGAVMRSNAICSDSTQLFKPDPRAFAEAEFRASLAVPGVQEFVFVDDSPANVAAAADRPGWTPVHFPADAALGDIASRIILNTK
jgi:FMN phosphatase YigB (HAD superfamily)